MRTHPILILILLIVSSSSCTKELEYPLTVENKLVLNTIIKPWERIVFHVSTTANMLSQYSKDSSDYHLKFYSGDLLLLDTMIKQGVYTSELYGGGLKRYHATLSKEGLPGISAEDSIPVMVFIKKAICQYPTGYKKDWGKYGTMNITFSDPPEERNYYELIIHANLDLIHEYTDLITDPVLINEGDIDYLPTSFFFSDELFNGQTHTISISGAYPSGKAYLRHTSKAYYLYRKYYTRHAYNQQFQGDFWTTIFMGEPQSMYTNIEGGYGIFAGYMEHSKDVVVIEN